MKITASADELLRQAPMTAAMYFSEACTAIDRQFGNGYAGKHPELIVGFMQVAARDFATATVTCALQNIAEAIEMRR